MGGGWVAGEAGYKAISASTGLKLKLWLSLAKFHKDIEETNRKNNRVDTCKRFSKVYYSSFCICFVITFWILGLRNYMQE